MCQLPPVTAITTAILFELVLQYNFMLDQHTSILSK